MSSRRGKEAEFFLDMYYTRTGLDVAVPITGVEAYDRLVRFAGLEPRWKMVQVKRVYLKGKNRSRTVNLVRANGEPYKLTDFDYLAAVDLETGDIWMIPVNVVAGYTRRRINKAFDKWRVT